MVILKTCFMNMYTHTTIGSKLAEWGGSFMADCLPSIQETLGCITEIHKSRCESVHLQSQYEGKASEV